MACNRLLDNNPWLSIFRYFEWIVKIQKCFTKWGDKFDQLEITCNELLAYEQNYKHFLTIEVATSLITKIEDVQAVKKLFDEKFQSLNILLLQYIFKPDMKWCPLPALLGEYDVHFPTKIQNLLRRAVSFPDHDGVHSKEDAFYSPTNYSRTNGKFNLGRNISLKVYKNVTVKELTMLVEEVDKFQKPLVKYYKALVFFKDEGILFNKYLRYYIKNKTPMQQDSIKLFSSSASLAPSMIQSISQGASQETSSLKTFVSGLERASKLIRDVLSGTATYSEIIAGDEEMLNRLDINQEIAILAKYGEVFGLCCDGLKGVQSILELSQYTTHCESIVNVCEQYNLTGCLTDPSLEHLREIVKLNSSEEARMKITPNEAKSKMDIMKEILCLNEGISTECLSIFEAASDSVPLYRFMTDKNFSGEDDIFQQQYDLIAADLQHEEYDEQVLNQLKPAVKIIAPFLKTQQDLKQLMLEIVALTNPTERIKQLKFVNENIMTIFVWS